MTAMNMSLKLMQKQGRLRAGKENPFGIKKTGSHAEDLLVKNKYRYNEKNAGKKLAFFLNAVIIAVV